MVNIAHGLASWTRAILHRPICDSRYSTLFRCARCAHEWPCSVLMREQLVKEGFTGRSDRCSSH